MTWQRVSEKEWAARRERVRLALLAVNGDRVRAARMLGIPQATLAWWMDRFVQSDKGQSREPDDPLMVLPRERADQFAQMIAIHLEYGRFEHVGRVLARARMEIAAGGDVARASANPSEVALAEIGLEIRTVNTLEEYGLFTCAQALEAGEAELLRIPNFGDAGIANLRKTLAAAFSLPWSEEDEAARLGARGRKAGTRGLSKGDEP